MRLRHAGAGLYFFLLAVMFAVFFGIAYIASGGSPGMEAVIPVFVGATVFAGIIDLLLIGWIDRKYGSERLKKIERTVDIIFLIVVFLPCLIVSVWMWMHSIFGGG